MQLPQQSSEFTQYLLFNHDNFVSEDLSSYIKPQNSPHKHQIKKQAISPWNQHNNQYPLQLMNQGNKIQNKTTTKIEAFLKTIQNKIRNNNNNNNNNNSNNNSNSNSNSNNSNNGFRSKLYKKQRRFIHNNNTLNILDYNPNNPQFSQQQPSSQHFLPLNNTVILFPSSRKHKLLKLDQQQAILLQKIYKKREKSKIIPKEISMNCIVNCNRNGRNIVENSQCNGLVVKKRGLKVGNVRKGRNSVSNTEEKYIKQIKQAKQYKQLTQQYHSVEHNKTSISSSISKNPSTFQRRMQTKNTQFLRNLRNSKGIRKLNSLHEIENNQTHRHQRQYSIKMYKTLYSSPKLMNNEEELSIGKIREDAKNTHLNRIKNASEDQMHLLGETINCWKANVQKKFKGKINGNGKGNKQQQKTN